MRLLIAAVFCALAATACSDPCKDLGNRLCECTPVGTTKAACERTVQAEVDRLNPNGDAKDACAKALETCNAPADVPDFCDWSSGRCGKAACGISEEKIDTLRTTPADPSFSGCDPDPSAATCPKICAPAS